MEWAPVSVYENDADGPTGKVARFVIPRHTFQARLAAEIAEREGIQSMVSRQVHEVSASNFPEESRFIWPNHESDAKGEKPLALLHQAEGQMPMLVLGGGVYHWRDLLDQAREARHYQPAEGELMGTYWDKVANENQMRQDRFAWVEKVKARRNGRRVFAFTKRWMPEGKDWI